MQFEADITQPQKSLRRAVDAGDCELTQQVVGASATMRDAESHETLRSATFQEWEEARLAPAPGFIYVDGRKCVVTDDD